MNLKKSADDKKHEKLPSMQKVKHPLINCKVNLDSNVGD